jgi:hypothetical protein
MGTPNKATACRETIWRLLSSRLTIDLHLCRLINKKPTEFRRERPGLLWGFVPIPPVHPDLYGAGAS